MQMQNAKAPPPAVPAPTWRPGQSAAELVAAYLRWRGVERVYGLCGGHIQPIWDELARSGIRVVDVRHECAAVYMAHAEAELTGRPGVALVTAGPGFTNAVTGVANASTARAPVLLLSGRPPRPQAGRGALQELPQRDIAAPLCRATLTADRTREVLPGSMRPCWRRSVRLRPRDRSTSTFPPTC